MGGLWGGSGVSGASAKVPVAEHNGWGGGWSDTCRAGSRQGAVVKETSLNQARASGSQHKCQGKGGDEDPNTDGHWTSGDP